MADRLTGYFDTADRKKFWLHMVIFSFALWAVSGIVSIFKPQGGVYAFNEVLGGTSSCMILASAILCIVERKKDRGELSKKQKNGETMILILFLAIVIFAEVLAVFSGTVSYGVPMTLAGAAVDICFMIAGSAFEAKRKLTMPEILKIICLGAAASVAFAQFFRKAADILSALS